MNIPENLFIIIDVLVAAIFLFCIIKGVLNGFIYELINFIFLAFSFICGWFISPILAKKAPLFVFDIENELAENVAEILSASYTINNISWLVIIVLILNLLFLLIKPIFKKFSKIPVIGSFNRVLGGFLGAVRALIICLLISVLLTMPIVKNGKDAINNSVLKYGDDITNFVTKFIVERVNFDHLKEDLDGIDVDVYREELADWLTKNGVLDE